MGLFFNIFVAVFSSIGAFLFGGIISSVLTMNLYKVRFEKNTAIEGAVVSTFSGGCFFGALLAGWVNDKLGRKRAIQLGCIFALWGGAMQSGANNVATLLIGRIIGGFAIGYPQTDLLQRNDTHLLTTEISPPKNRGFIVGLNQQMLGIGFIVANWVGYGCQFINSDVSWRFPLGFQRWLLEVNRDEEAKSVVYLLHGKGNEEASELEYREMHDTIKAEALVRTRKLSSLWATPAMLKRTLVAVGVQVFGQFTGVNVINYFGPTMYASLGVTGHSALLVQGFIIFMADRIGRKKPLVFGAGSFVVTFSVLAAIVATNPPGVEGSSATAQRAGIAMIFLTSVLFSLSFGPVSWVLASEVFPTSARSLGTMVATCSNWAFNVMLAQVSPIAMANISWKFYVLFVVLNFVDCILIAFFFPETKGLSLEEMNEVFGDQVDISGRQAPSVEKA
ncbi:hypothetical protein H0H92_009803 [Tricholoma furcatifolium]|nr:hypothetical protein H0H92_009803 [Tricholoma furcatifolium]